jgi:hypothetical protein
LPRGSPHPAIVAGARQILPGNPANKSTFHKSGVEKRRAKPGKNWFTAAQRKVNNCERVFEKRA